VAGSARRGHRARPGCILQYALHHQVHTTVRTYSLLRVRLVNLRERSGAVAGCLGLHPVAWWAWCSPVRLFALVASPVYGACVGVGWGCGALWGLWRGMASRAGSGGRARFLLGPMLAAGFFTTPPGLARRSSVRYLAPRTPTFSRLIPLGIFTAFPPFYSWDSYPC